MLPFVYPKMFEKYVILYGKQAPNINKVTMSQFEKYVIFYGFKTDDNEPKFS